MSKARYAIYLAAIAAGILVATLGSQPLWIPAVVALLAFPIAGAIAVRRSRGHGRRPARPSLGAALFTALAGGLLAALALRLAFDAPGWLSAGTEDCGGASTATQQLVLWGGAVIFAASALPITATVFSVGRRLGADSLDPPPSPPLALYPIAVAGSGLALVTAGYVTTC